MAANYVLLEKITVGAAGAASVTFSGIPQTGYTDLVVRMSVRDTSGAGAVGAQVQFNSSTTGYTYKRLLGTGSVTQADSDLDVIVIGGGGTTANTFSNGEIYIPNYTSANYKSASLDGVYENNATSAYVALSALLLSNTAAITSVKIISDGTSFAQYSTFYLYGVAALGTTPVIVPYATGGDTIMTDGSYWYHTFVSSGTFTPQKALTAHYLVVAGGGGGGNFSGAGGGAGGLRCTVTATGGGGSLESALSLTTTGYTVTVGAGGTGSAGLTDTATSGSNSVFSTITSTGGGYGAGAATPRVGANGGSGGGAGYNVAGGTGTANQGFAGGTGRTGDPYLGGGGGGAGAVGGNAFYAFPVQTNAVGGAGVATSISGSSVTYGGGGGASTGGNWANPSGNSGGAGGAGGGGAGGNVSPSLTNGTAGTANTGGGGGGAGSTTTSLSAASAGAGGSGIVIVRYAV